MAELAGFNNDLMLCNYIIDCAIMRANRLAPTLVATPYQLPKLLDDCQAIPK